MSNKRNVVLYLDKELVEKTRELGFNLSTRSNRNRLNKIAESLGIGESEVLRQAFMEYAKSISLIAEKVHLKAKGESDG